MNTTISSERSPDGSTWRLWDFHCHTPASYQWKGERLNGRQSEVSDKLVQKTVEALKKASPDVFVIMDYWTFEGYLAIIDYVRANPGSLDTKTIFPGIELRVESSLSQRLNVHLVIDPSVETQIFRDVLSTLKINLKDGDRSLSDACFRQHARELGIDRLIKGGYNPDLVQSSDEHALRTGFDTAMVTPQSLIEALKLLGDHGLLLMPWDTYGGLREIDWVAHYAEVRRFRKNAEIFECKDEGNRQAFHGVKTEKNENYFDAFWKSLDGKPRLCVRGTDAHSLATYGVFPGGMKTWLKTEPTFRGLRHAIKEPVFRSYMGDNPPKKDFVEANGRLFMRRIQIHKVAGSIQPEKWFGGTDILLNPDLVAIIGNKGSGKSGLAEVLALAGNSKSHEFFTFLVDQRFKGGSAQRAAAFKAELTWRSGETETVLLSQSAKPEQPERVKYISQIYFEEICNDHVAGTSDRFGAEIRKVLFSHLDPSMRGKYENLDTYLAAIEKPSQDRLLNLRARLKSVSLALEQLEDQSAQSHLNDLKEKLAGKELELKDVESKQPTPVAEPSQAATPENSISVSRLSEITHLYASLNDQNNTALSSKRLLQERLTVLTSVMERLSTLRDASLKASEALAEELAQVGIDIKDLYKVQIKNVELLELSVEAKTEAEEIAEMQRKRNLELLTLKNEQELLQSKLDEPNRLFQVYKTASDTWSKSKQAIIGSSETPETIEYYKKLIADLSELPTKCTALETSQDAIAKEIHIELLKIAEARRSLFNGVEKIVESVPGVADELKVGFQSGLFFDADSFSRRFFDFVKQNTGGFRGDEEGPAKLKALLRQIDFADSNSVVVGFRSIRNALTAGDKVGTTLLQILRTKVSAHELYEVLFGLTHIEPRFTLSLAGTTIQQMSPGQRGALLLIFYLLVDTDPAPLILDQPEENLDNQTVYSMLVPIIQLAKQKRQIIMVTHNANLAVCCDAEQIIHAEFDRADHYSLRYVSGAIENSALNKSVLDVLEGTNLAFANRSNKYFGQNN